jgi:branched-chain amino acid aminotransferase
MTQYAFFKGAIVPIEQAKISIMTHAFNYGTGCFEGIRGYWNEDDRQLYVFRLLEHYRRLLQSAKILLMSPRYSAEQLCDITVELLRREDYHSDAYIRPVAYKTNEQIGVRLHDLNDDLCIFATPFGRYVDNEEGAHVGFSSWQRISDNNIPPRGKITGAYVNSAFMKTEAMLNGYDEALVINAGGHVCEGSAENIFLVMDGKLVTPGVYECALTGITRNTVIELAKNELGMETVERPVDRSELYTAQELFFTGTATHVAAIGEVDHRPVGDGKMGPVTTKLHDIYFDVIRGKNPKYMKWCTPVY